MSDDTAFASATYDVEDPFEANELFQRNGWTDGLPIVPPTESAVITSSTPRSFTAESGATSVRPRLPGARTKIVSIARCARPRICSSSPPAVPQEVSARSCRRGMERNPLQ